MKNLKLIYTYLLLIAVLSFGCKKDDDSPAPPEKADIKLTSFSFLAATNPNMALAVEDVEDLKATIDAEKNTITLDVSAYVYVDALIPTFELPKGATVKVGDAAQTSGTTPQDFSSPVKYDVTLEGETKSFTVTVDRSQYATIPDAKFREKLKALKLPFKDDKLEAFSSQVQAQKILGRFGVENPGLSDILKGRLNLKAVGIINMKGIEFFINLEEIDASGNNFASLNLLKNPKLKVLLAGNNPEIETIKMASTALDSLNANGAIKLTEKALQPIIDANPGLKELFIRGTGVTSIKLEALENLETLEIDEEAAKAAATAIKALLSKKLKQVQIFKDDTGNECTNYDPETFECVVPPSVETPVFYKTSELLRTYTKEDLKTVVNAGGIEGLLIKSLISPSKLKYDVDVYKVEYASKLNDKDITESSLVAIPKTSDLSTLPVISYQHGTIVRKNSQEPTVAVTKNEIKEGFLICYFASLGFTITARDYVGFGTSGDEYHPYIVKEVAQKNSVNNLMALKEFAAEKALNIGTNLHLAGYSQGGYNSVVLQQHIEQNPIENFTLKKTFAGGGAYNLNTMLKFAITTENYQTPYYIGYVSNAYLNYYSEFTDNTLAKVYKAEKQNIVETYYDGIKASSEINAALTTVNTDIYTQSFIDDVTNDRDLGIITEKLTLNSITGWDIETELYLYHGSADVSVTPKSSRDLYKSFNGNSKVQFKEFSGLNHTSAAPSFFGEVASELTK